MPQDVLGRYRMFQDTIGRFRTLQDVLGNLRSLSTIFISKGMWKSHPLAFSLLLCLFIHFYFAFSFTFFSFSFTFTLLFHIFFSFFSITQKGFIRRIYLCTQKQDNSGLWTNERKSGGINRGGSCAHPKPKGFHWEVSPLPDKEQKE